MSKIARFTLVLGLALSGASLSVSAQESVAAASKEQTKVVYHINDAANQALAALRSMRNHLDTARNTKIIAVAHGDGIDFLQTDYKDADTVGPLISGLASRGVQFEVCEITMSRNELTKDDFVMEAQFTPSGVVRIAELQSKEGYVYIKP
ncbi:DsrE family protein [Pusillimonas sp. SM2304]|uniref:DsrE family protein n=1 Tax=Pusillimonas sp. SM2304 TaxID=3073241 RepID=UPI002874E439|nr:DsrE family protein [Pusillimonas sp. SM2304]MDS1142271.1 DsrE family protein [Pusillimonas sp. SM2304]